MKIVLQRVSGASVETKGRKAGIGKGILLFVGVSKEDTPGTAEKLADKISRFRIFEDERGKMNLDISQVRGEILSVPQFTLLGDTDKGNRPGFDKAESPLRAKELWSKLNRALERIGINVEEGFFGEHMSVNILNDGPVTFIIEN